MRKPVVVTMGEPCSIGAHLVVRAWEKQICPFFYLGDENLIKEISLIPTQSIKTGVEAEAVFPNSLPILPLLNKVKGSLHSPSKGDSTSIIESLETAISLALKGEAGAIVTNPVQKKSLQLDGKGQTEYIAQTLGVEKFAMMFMEGDLRVTLVTTHVQIKEIHITTEEVKNKILLTREFLKRKLNIPEPRIAVLGLNPHAGENGLLGKEDSQIIEPACRATQAIGPIPGDAAFSQYKKYDALVAMYHDQGLAPFKALAKGGVNITMGLPILRVSPVHGTGVDLINNPEKIDHTSFTQAMEEAYRLSNDDKA